jgi:hypothetical protein
LGILKSEGIPDHAIQLYGQDLSSTREEALAVKTWLTSPSPASSLQSQPFPIPPQVSGLQSQPFPLPPSSLLIPTDPFATRRTNAFFGKTLPDCDVRVIRTDPRDLNVETWWTQEQGLIAFQNEVIKWLFYKIKY